MLLNIVFLLTGCTAATFAAKISEGPYFTRMMGPVDEGKKSKENETYNRTNGSELHAENDPSLIDDYYFNDRLEPSYDYPDYNGYEVKNVIESDGFKEEWKNVGAMEVSFIGRSKPVYVDDDIRKREISGKRSVSNHRFERDVHKAFNRNKGCNRLPMAPDNSEGTCHHSNTIAKCWVLCHRFNRYPDDTKQKTFICLDGDWKPKKLPDCVPRILCEDIHISGRNMNVTCVHDSGIKKCTATCESDATFGDNKNVKIIECEKKIDGYSVSRIKFPDCYFD